MINSFVEMNENEAIDFMKGFQKLTEGEKKIITFLLTMQDHAYTGTLTDIAQIVGTKNSYASEISRAMGRVSEKGIVTIHEPIKWYIRKIELSEDWRDKLIAFGKEEENDDK